MNKAILSIGDFVVSTSVDTGQPVNGIFCVIIEPGIIMVATEQGGAFRCNAKHARLIPDSELSANTIEFARSYRRKEETD